MNRLSFKQYGILFVFIIEVFPTTKKQGLSRDLNPGPLAPKARIIPLDQRAAMSLRLKISLYPYLI